ncbi:hypothetical protein E7V67_014675 [[Empedobacter] haloabium]|uniref:Uncharacterized protein n=1 Tax=[Empedobacter] haloabium TaxID=592317 RepID=A0ABZ1UFX9_9BURK
MAATRVRRLCGKLAIAAGVPAMLWLTLLVQAQLSPLVVLHYSSAATAPIAYFFDEDSDIIKDVIHPGERLGFRTTRWPRAGYHLDVSFPFSSRDGVELAAPFSRVDIYLDAHAKVVRTTVDTGFWARIGPD